MARTDYSLLSYELSAGTNAISNKLFLILTI